MIIGKNKFLLRLVKSFLQAALGVFVLGIIVSETIKQFPEMIATADATAEVILTDVVEKGDGDNAYSVIRAIYEFRVGKRLFTGYTDYGSGETREGDKVQIKYHPRNPNRNHVIGDYKARGRLFVVYLFGGLFAYFFISLSIPELFPVLLARKYKESMEEMSKLTEEAYEILKEKNHLKESFASIMKSMNKLDFQRSVKLSYLECLNAYINLRLKGNSKERAIEELKSLFTPNVDQLKS